MSTDMDMMDMTMDNAAATRDATQTIGAAMERANPAAFSPGVSQDWWTNLIAQVQQLFMRLEMMLQGIESRVDMNLSNLENTLSMLPYITPAQRQSIMERLDMAQGRVDMRFDNARTMLQTQQQSAVDRLMTQEMARPPGMGMAGGGGVMRGRRPRIPRVLPPGIARQMQMQMGRPLPPPGLARQMGMDAAALRRRRMAARLGAP
jgi:hypothetical protein